MDTKKLLNILNDILNECIPKNKKSKFYAVIDRYKLNSNDYVYNYNIKCGDNGDNQEPTSGKIPIDELRRKLFSTYVDYQFNLEELKGVTKIIEKCDSLAKKITFDKKRNKIYHYYFGSYLEMLKDEELKTSKEFIDFVSERYQMKKSTIYKYIQFAKLCDFKKEIVTCDLTFDQIIKNIPEIESILF